MLPRVPERAGLPQAGTPSHETNAGANSVVPARSATDHQRSRAWSATRPDARTLLDAPDVARVVDRIAHEILEKTDGGRDVVCLGIPSRGVPLARRIARRMHDFEGVDVRVGVLDVTLYRDDLRRQPVRPLEDTTVPDGGIDDKVVILIDDVLFSGRTIRAALDALRDLGRPSVVQVAVLADRGHRELPIRADYVGKNLPTRRDEQVIVLVSELDGQDGVVLIPGGPQ